MTLGSIRFLILALALQTSLLFADLVDPAPHVEANVRWSIGEMRGDPGANLVYVINQTDDQIIALNTDTGNITQTAQIPDAARDGRLEFSIDGTKLYFSTPFTNRLHTFSTGSLNYLGSVSLPASIKSFIIGSDGYLYGVKERSGWDELLKINITTGVVVDSHQHSSWDPHAPLIRNTSGTRFFHLDSFIDEWTIQANAMPANAGRRYNYTGSNNRDLTFDDGLNTLYRAAGGSHGIDTWNITVGAGAYWPSGASHGHAVEQISGASDVFLASGSTYDGRISRFNKTTAVKLHDYHVSGSLSSFVSGSFLQRRLAVTPNGHVVYGKITSSDDYYLGLIGHSSLNIPKDAPEEFLLPHVEIETSWTIGDVLGDPSRNLIYIVDETNLKLIALNTETGLTSAEVSIPASPIDGKLALSPDGSALYLSTPNTFQVHQYTAGESLSVAISRLMPFVVKSFAIGSDGHLYGADSGNLKKVNLSTRTVIGETSSPRLDSSNLVRRNSSGSRLYVMTLGRSSGSGTVETYSVGSGPPVHEGKIFNNGSNDRDLSIDESRDVVFRSSGGAYGLTSWQLSEGIQNFWPYDAPYGSAVCQVPGAQTVFGASTSNIIRQFDKDSGKTIRTIDYNDSDLGLFGGDVSSAKMEMAANEVVAYGKNISVFGVIGLNRLVLPRSGPQLPTGLQATKGAHLDKITLNWNRSLEATRYEIYRDSGWLSSVYPGSTPYATVNGSETTVFEDVMVEADKDYYYWIKAVNDFGESMLTPVVAGHIQGIASPGRPDGLAASNGTFQSKIEVSWNALVGATGYSVYRSTSNQPEEAMLIADDITATTWDDTEVEEGEIYFYWVAAYTYYALEGEDHTGLLSISPASGYAGLFPLAPTGLMASDGSVSGKVSLSWNSVPEAISYSVYRGSSSDPAQALMVAASLAGTSWQDIGASPDEVYYYWVVASKTEGSSVRSELDSGFAPEDPFSTWGDSNGLSATENDFAHDPDGDGNNNLHEFAFDGDPTLSNHPNDKISSPVGEVEGKDYLTITFPVRDGAVFSGSTSKSAIIDGIQYTVEAGSDLSSFDKVVIEVTPAHSSGMPAVSSGWSYRTFRYQHGVSDTSKGFLKLRVATVE